ncbi:TPA: polysaccharide biosynthesis C-terminal domain-containing protein [Streptococcus suis]|nr:polysaccharide biosynthesis C-terminal domain-containing protein [Streptococcus suis]HEM3724432.1 polysaccharide biosynthesis C-terminal domain-containing protein [Streptococcus suis]
MSRERKLVKNTAIVALGQIGTKFISFFLLPLYTAVLSTEEYGTVDLLNTYVSLLIPIIFLQMDQAIFRFLIDHRKDNEEKTKLISTVFFTVALHAILYLIVFGIVGNFIHNPYKYFLATNVVTSMFSSMLLQTSRGLGDNVAYSLGSLVSGAGTIVLNVMFIVVFRWGAYGMLFATMLANILCMIFVFFKLKVYKYLSLMAWNRSILNSIWKYSIPLVPNALSWWIINASDRTIVSQFLGVAANGVYSASNKFSAIVITFFSIFNMTWTESASMYIKDNDSSEYFSNIINVTIKLFTSICLLVIAIMPFSFSFFITGSSFAEAYMQIPILLIATLFNIIVSLLGSIYVALKKSNEIAKTSIYSAIINIVINILLIRYIGLFAASISTLLAYLSMSIYRYIDVQKYVRIKIDFTYVIIILPLIILVLFTYYLNNMVLCFVSLLLTLSLGLYFNKNILRQILQTALRRVNIH